MNHKLIYFIILALCLSSIAPAQQTGQIKGTITEQSTGFAIPQMEIGLIGENRLQTITSSNANGEYVFTNIPVGAYEVMLMTDREMTKRKLSVQAGQSTLLDYKLLPSQVSRVGTGRFAGVVTEQGSKKPVPRAMVLIMESKMGIETNAKGQFVLPDQPYMTYTLQISASGYAPKTLQNVLLSGDPIKIIDVELEKMPDLLKQSFQVRHRPPGEIFERLRSELGPFGQIVSMVGAQITLKDTPERIAGIKALLSELDLPPASIWLKMSALVASSDGPAENTLPDDLRTISKKLESLFRYKSYKLLESAHFSALENERCSILFGQGHYRTDIQRVEVARDNSPVIKLKDIAIIKLPENIPVLMTSVSIPQGDTIILGASNADATGKALIVIVKAELVKQ